MPYIEQEDRPSLDAGIAALPHGGTGLRAGDLAYLVYRLLLITTRGGSFLTYATMVGATVLTVARFVQKVVFKYEDKKEAENGGVE